MDAQIIAALITRVFGLITGIAVSKADSIQLDFWSKRRKLRQNWRGFTQRIAVENGGHQIAGRHKCTMAIKQKGRKISGEMRTESENSQRIYEYSIKQGIFEGDYLALSL